MQLFQYESLKSQREKPQKIWKHYQSMSSYDLAYVIKYAGYAASFL